MKATNLLKRQHRQAERLFRQITRSKEETERMELMTQLADALAAHMAIEEQIFYPAVQGVLTGKKVVMGESALLEHQMAKMALENVLTDSALSFEARVKVLKDLVEHHVEEEEQDMFPEVEARMDDLQLKMLGAEMQAMHEQAMGMGHKELLRQAMTVGGAAGAAGGEMAETNENGSNGRTKARASQNGAGRASSRSTSSGRSHARA
jgi:hemerythrin superfamily protein